MGLGKTKTYVSASITNLYSKEAEEIRMAYMAVIEAAMAKEYTSTGSHVATTQLGANGVKYRNYCYWARRYKFSDLHNEDIGADERTWTEMLNYYEPQVSASANLNQEDIKAFLIRDFDFNPELQEIASETRVCACKFKSTGTVINLPITFKTYIREKYTILNSYCGKYFYSVFGEAYLWSKEEYFEKFNACIYTGDTTYNIVMGNSLSDDEGNTGSGTPDDIYIQFGYSVPEEHEIVEGEGLTTENVFYDTESIFVPLKQELGINDNSKYLCLAGYIYTDTLQENFEKEDDLILIDDDLNPFPLSEFTQKYFEYDYENEGYDGPISQHFTSTINIEDCRPIGLIISEEELKQDSLLSNIYEDPGDVTINLAPPICFKNDKQWLDENNNPYWYYRNKAVCRKIYTSFTYYQELMENLYEPCSNGDIGWVYLFYGLPTNTVQMDYCARYALQFFKQLTISDWNSIIPGMETSRDVGRKSWQYGSNTFNFHFNFSVGGISYRTGLGKCPVKPDCRRGECGFEWYGGQATLWRQWDTDAWEYLIVKGYSTSFNSIKNGKNAGIGGDGWTDAIWKNEETQERNYSKAVIPISAEVGTNIPLTDWTDLTQYIGNIGVTSYKVVKIKWYQTGIFQVIVIVVMIIVTIIVAIFAPYALPSTMLTFGTVVGAGAVLLNMLVAAAICYAAAIACNALLRPILVDLLGDFWGNLLTNIAIIVITLVCCNVSVLSPSTWTSPYTLTAVWGAYNQAQMSVVQSKFEDLQKEQNQVTAQYESLYNNLQQKSSEAGISGYGISYTDMMLLGDPATQDRYTAMDMTEAPLDWVESFADRMSSPQYPEYLA